MYNLNRLTITLLGLLASGSLFAMPSDLTTQSRRDIGLSLSGYHYSETGGRTLQGTKIGFELLLTKDLHNGQFVRGEIHYGFGNVSMSGASTNQQDWYIDARQMLGFDWAIDKAVLSPYIGLGYHYGFNDLRGATNPSVSGAGYRRESAYVTLPIGAMHRVKIKDQSRLVTTFEYAPMLTGKQTSHLSDMGQGYSDLDNNQRSGYGLRFSAMYEQKGLSVGPFAYLWKMSQSDSGAVLQNFSVVGQRAEPQNTSLEVGLKATKEF